MIKNYEEQVYAAVLGKVIGVYMGRPFEGWTKDKLMAELGPVTTYVAAKLEKPLIVPDDDITGTFTFNRILKDSGLYEKTPAAMFGENWLNYIVPCKSILWWGGTGYSTEHTAFERLKQGYKAPKSGSIGLNGRVVAEQIGAQIFIDAFGMVAPGRPALAARLAKKAAEVSHDGEATFGAIVVAAMVAAAFVEKDMNKLLDIGVSFIPQDSIIARVHRDVRAWARKDGNWEVTYARIKARYGYDKYSGNCHIVPNHAIMVMAWAYAPDNFRKSQEIINTAGWDTDCNAANVGSVMGLVVGLEGITADYDFRTPFADRIILPTAEGTRSLSDCLTEAYEIAAMGRRIMGWDPLPAPKDGAWHHFSQPGALHGWMASAGRVTVANIESDGRRAMRLKVQKNGEVSVPLIAIQGANSYGAMGTSRLYPGMTLTLKAKAASGKAGVNLFISCFDNETKAFTCTAASKAVPAAEGKNVTITWKLPDTTGSPIGAFGIAVKGTCELLVDSVALSGTPALRFKGKLPAMADAAVKPGWITDINIEWCNVHGYGWMQFFNKNTDRGHMVTGTTDWAGYTAEADFLMHCGDKGGMLVNYQGLRRYIALVIAGSEIQLIRQYYGEKVLASKKVGWEKDELHKLKLIADHGRITAFADGKKLFTHKDADLTCGGAGFLVERGNAGFGNFTIKPA